MGDIGARLIKSRWLTAVAASLVTAIAVGTAALAVPPPPPPPPSSPTMYACADQRGGLRLVDVDTSCKATETKYSWNKEGPAGAAGPPGPAGGEGPAGPAGSLAGIDDLEGKPCREGEVGEGVLSIDYDAEGVATMTCGGGRFTLTVSVVGAAGSVVGDPDDSGGSSFICSGGTTPTCEPSFLANTLVRLEPLPMAGAEFVGWTGECVVSGEVCTVSMTEARDVQAEFRDAPYFTLTVDLFNEGCSEGECEIVVSDGQDFTCRTTFGASETCEVRVAADTSISLFAQGSLAGGSLRWGGDCADVHLTTRPCDLVMDRDRYVSVTLSG